jgi:hypothetical protein
MAKATDLKSLARVVFLRNAARDLPSLRVSRPPSRGRDTSRQARDPLSPASEHVLVAYGRRFALLRARCPDRIEADDWQQAIEDGRRFLARWGEQAAALGWTARDLFGLHTSPAAPARSYRRLSRYDKTGLIWLLRGRPVVALTAGTAAIENYTGAITLYRRHP